MISCSQTAGITLLELPDTSDPLDAPPIVGVDLGPDDLHVQDIHRAHDGVVYLSGYSEFDRQRVAKVYAWNDGSFDTVLDGTNLGMEQVIGFARQPGGVDLAIGGQQEFAYRSNDRDWQLASPDSDRVGFSGTGADLIEHNGRLIALGRSDGLSTLLLQDGTSPRFTPAVLPDMGLSLTSLSSDGTDLAVGFNDRSLGIAGVLVAAAPSDAAGWDLLIVDEDEADIHAVCRHEGRTIAVGTLNGTDGFVTSFGSGASFVEETQWLQQPAYACHLDDDGFVLVGGDGYLYTQ